MTFSRVIECFSVNPMGNFAHRRTLSESVMLALFSVEGKSFLCPTHRQIQKKVQQ